MSFSKPFRGAKPRRRTAATKLRLLALEDRVVPAAGIADQGFELPAVGAGAFRYNPAGCPWAFGGSAGVTSNGSAFTAANPGAPQGSQVAFLQQLGTASTNFAVSSGTFVITFMMARRGNFGGNPTFRALVDGNIV